MPTMTPEYRAYVLEIIQEADKSKMTIERCQEALRMEQKGYEYFTSTQSIANNLYAKNAIASKIYYWECVIEILTELAEQEQEQEEVKVVIEVSEVAPVNPVRRTTRYNRIEIMRRAWELKKEHPDNIFALCLKMAWKEAKYTVADLEIGDVVEMSLGITEQKARALYYTVENIKNTGKLCEVTLRNQFGSESEYYLNPNELVKLVSKALRLAQVA